MSITTKYLLDIGLLYIHFLILVIILWAFVELLSKREKYRCAAKFFSLAPYVLTCTKEWDRYTQRLVAIALDLIFATSLILNLTIPDRISYELDLQCKGVIGATFFYKCIIRSIYFMKITYLLSCTLYTHAYIMPFVSKSASISTDSRSTQSAMNMFLDIFVLCKSVVLRDDLASYEQHY